MTRLRTIALCLCLALLPIGAGTTYVALDPYEVLARADAVLTAQITDVRAETRDEHVWTVVSLDVTEWLTEDPTQDDDEDEPAEPRETLELEFLGGESEGRRLLVAGAISWEPGAEVLIAMYEEEGAASPVVGFRQGLWRVSEEGLVDPDGRALALDAAGRLVRADRPAAAATVLDAVRQALAGDAPEPQEEAAEPEDASETDALREPADPAGEEQPDEELDEPPDGERAPADPSAPETPAAPTEAIARSYAVDDAGGPLLLSERLEAAASTWESLAPGTIEMTAAAGAEHRFAYGDAALFGPDLLSLSVVEDGGVDVLVRPDEHPSVDAALRHELGVLLGLGPSATGVMSMEVSGGDLTPGEAELAELAAISAFAREDLDRDGVVGFGDLLELAAAYGRSGLNLPADLDGDGDVDENDLAALRAAYAFAPPLGATQGDPGGGTPAGETVEPDAVGPAEQDEPDEPDEPDGPETEPAGPGG
ncbi:MAG TPA: hypothetical protein VFF10_02420 [Trueperaceae bacterium]|nr:hypothetical protein [Trueperaceae bacterium]